MGEYDGIIYLTKFRRIDMVVYLHKLIRWCNIKYIHTELYMRNISLNLTDNYCIEFDDKPGIIKLLRNDNTYTFYVNHWFLLRVNESMLYYTHELSNIIVINQDLNKEYKFNWIPYGYDKYSLY